MLPNSILFCIGTIGGFLAYLESAVLQSAYGAADTVHRGSADESRAVHLPDDSDHCRHRWWQRCRPRGASQIAHGFPDAHLRIRTRARVRVARIVRRSYGDTLR